MAHHRAVGRLVANIAAAAVVAGALTVGPAQAANSFGDSAHSHFDIHLYQKHEVTWCYKVVAKATGAGTRIANLPHREVNGSNNMELRLETNGLRLVKRVNGVATELTNTLPSPGDVFGPGSIAMFDYVMDGNTFTAYDFTGEVRGAAKYRWVDAANTYPTGVSISYYTIGGWQGEWLDAHGRPLDTTGFPHDLLNLAQDARGHPQVATEATFDSPDPADGGASSIQSNATDGVPSGLNYTYTITSTGAGTFDFRDPGTATDTQFWKAGWYRFTLAGATTNATIRRYTGTGTLAATYTATGGGPGTYTIVATGPNLVVKKSGATILTVTDPAGNSSGLRVRIMPTGGSSWTWAGQAN